MTSIHDVAALAGVSTATVSRALRGVDRVSVPTRDRVLHAAATLHYVASPAAASLASGRTGVVGVVVPFLSRWFFSHVLDGIERRLRECNLHVLLFNVGTGSHRGVLLDLERLHKRLDAMVIVSCDLRPDEVSMLGRLNVPIVTVGVDVGGWDLVRIDDAATADAAMTHLLQLGHRRIAYLGGDQRADVHLATSVDRARGVRRALVRAGLSPDAAGDQVADWTVTGGMDAVEDLLDRASPPSAILASSDEMAMGVLRELRRRGLQVPEQLSVMGIDGHDVAITHDLTTMAQPVLEQGEAAAQLLVDVLRGSAGTAASSGERRVITLPTSLRLGGTTGPVGAPLAITAR